ncbi:MAG: ribonuclease HII [Nitrospirae bacterium RIFCSPLOWO2_01_FULL_62_17]|nr:MAG: ribonuclease HII [Nitrospirae bacterium RIFCSPLOWO2_01_FULL_62_17]
MLPRRCLLAGLNDSKQLTELERERLYDEIRRRAVGIGVGLASEREIDEMNILEATRLAMGRAIQALPSTPDYLLLDAIGLPTVPLPQRAIIKGDALSVSIAAASVVAKVTRDRLMGDYHRQYPQYNFQAHKGYGTPEHLRLLAAHGPCAIHRRSFRPVGDAVPAVEQAAE